VKLSKEKSTLNSSKKKNTIIPLICFISETERKKNREKRPEELLLIKE
jgi:hypothetical protein